MSLFIFKRVRTEDYAKRNSSWSLQQQKASRFSPFQLSL